MAQPQRKSVYVAVWLDGSQPNKAYTRFDNANKSHFDDDNVEIYRHKILDTEDYSCVPNEDSKPVRKRLVTIEERERQAEYMREHYRRYICIAHNEETSEYKVFTRMQNLRIFCNSNQSFKGYRMLRSDWDERGVIYNAEQIC